MYTLQLPVKASSIKNLTDARYFAARGVQWMGFNLDNGHPESIPVQQISAIKEWIEGPQIVGEFGLQDHTTIKTAVEYLNLDAIQVSMFAEVEVLSDIIDCPIFLEYIVEDENLNNIHDWLSKKSNKVEGFIFDLTKNNISYQQVLSKNIDLFPSLCKKYNILFNLNITADAIDDFIKKVNPGGLILLGGDEEKVGYKSYETLDEILDFLEIEPD